MVKRWQYKDPDLDYSDRFTGDGVSYNAVEYKYKDVQRKGGVLQWETKNTVKFRDVLRRKGLQQDDNQSQKQGDDKFTRTAEETTQIEDHAENFKESKPHKKKKKKKSKTGGTSDEEVQVACLESQSDDLRNINGRGGASTDIMNDTSLDKDTDDTKLKKKKKKSKRKAESENDSSQIEESSAIVIDSQDNCDTNVTKKKKRKIATKESENDTVISDATIILDTSADSPVKKKKKKKRDHNKEGCAQNTEINDNSSVTVSDTPRDLTNSGIILVADVDDFPQKKKKKKRKDDKIPSIEVLGDSINDVYSTPKKKKRKRKSKGDDSEIKVLDSLASETPIKNKKTDNENSDCVQPITREIHEDVVIVSTSTKKKKKKDKAKGDDEKNHSNSEVLHIIGEELSTKAKKKKKKSRDKHESDIVCNNDVSEIPSNSDVQINGGDNPVKVKKKHKKSKKESDKAKNNVDNACGSKVNKVPVMGQWSTASFETSVRQEKFLRLMGGFKGATDSNVSNNTPVVKHNASLSAEGEKMLNEKLEKQYNTALNTLVTKGKGTGLGFEKDPAEGKKFHTDTHKSKSVKFDD